ncbi:hypothetical protein [Lewinella sp. 4G2]|uniref:hypothetical protein n=1 Tax=Lewinella sp. 4G2 TaxID=1803372 RepID=UPI0007B47916|nr:hypothetical protein [Lewinella sp. 4G2]OAV43175.1 hypothetical protein A3850_001095 [Lewinella sp. 4G2]
MKHIDDLFRDGLAGRKGEVPTDLWKKIQAAKPAAPTGEAFDGLFADALRDREAPVPIGMWDRIAAARALPRRRAFYAAAALALLLLLSAGLYLLGDDVNTQPEDNKIEESEIPAIPSDEGVVATTDDADIARSNNVVPPATASAASVTTPSTTNEASNFGALNAGAEKWEGGNADTQVSNPIATDLTDGTAATPTEIKSTAGAATDEVILTGERTTSTLAAAAMIPTRNAGAVSQLNEATTILPDFTKGKYRQQRSTAPSFSRAPRHRTQTEMLFGAAYANQNLSATDASDRQLLSARENSEFPEISFQVTLRQSYKLTDRVTLTGGLTYVDIRNQFDFEEVVNGTLQLTKKNNHIRMLEVPLLAGLTLPGKRFNVSLNAGPVFNLTTAVQGNFLDPDSPEPLSLSDDGNYRSYTGVGYMTSLTTTYAIGKKDPFVLVLEPFFKHYPGSFTRPGARISESYWLAGLQLGVRKGL